MKNLSLHSGFSESEGRNGFVILSSGLSSLISRQYTGANSEQSVEKVWMFLLLRANVEVDWVCEKVIVEWRRGT